ncbi:carbohydrate binding domain-containing protein [Flavobacterium sp. LHD-80]|uniref:carbohydrate binding domain-containing protein n=1 Tax=Flavobacterium sp. LHD-80 TaxID=3071411 RepID=UPI0027DEF2D5|nr:carbohydrate binding domain-containing protein [Flavobacterium sp. LHD-80]MDQ6470981.1 carbohydrate binding domain-containing protein [Flavobacterium sp. LHD-80]
MKTLFFFCSLFLITITNAQTNLVKNGGFETDLLNWRGEENAVLSPIEKKSGKKSAVINQFVGAEWKALDQIITLPKNTYALEVSAWIKSDAIETQKEEYKSGAVILEFTNSGDKQISTERIGQAVGSTNWTHFKKTIKVPAEARKIRIMLALAQTNGTVFFDDVKAITLSEEEYLKLNPIANPEK